MRWRWWLRLGPDLLVAAVAVGLGVATTWRSWWQPGAPGWVAAGSVLVGGVALGFARRYPVPVFGLVAVLLAVADRYAPSAANLLQLLLVVGLGYVAVRCQPTTIVACYGLAVAASAVNIIDADSDIRLTWWRVVLGLVMLAAPVAFGRYLAGRRELAEARRRQHAAEAATARLADRARDTADTVGRQLAAVTSSAAAARHPGTPPPVVEALDDIRDTGAQARSKLRELRAALDDPREPDAS